MVSLLLSSAAHSHLQFLKSVPEQLTVEGPALDGAIQAYLSFMNAMGKGQYDESLLTIAVQWVWHCHTLHPINYREDCIAAFGFVPDLFEQVKFHLNGWLMRFLVTLLMIFYLLVQQQASLGARANELKPSLDLKAACLRQRSFLSKANHYVSFKIEVSFVSDFFVCLFVCLFVISLKTFFFF
jgi:hypothetical protein